MTKTMEIKELVSELKEYDGELTVKVWSNGAEKPYPISNVAAGTMCAYIGIDDRNLVDLSKIWHDVNEEPKCRKAILCLNKKGNIYLLTNKIKLMYSLVQLDAGVDKWAYIDDLLPKGGEK